MLLSSISTIVSANIFRDGNVLSESSYSKEIRIIGGTGAMDGRYPYVVSLKSGSEHVCGGSLVAKDTVLTAAHCLGGFVSIAAVGDDVLGMGEEIAVKFEVVYPDYDSGTDQNDFGLMFLERSVSSDIPLLTLNDDSSLPEIGSTCYVMGWGDTDQTDAGVSLSDELMIVGLPVISNQDCDNASSGGDSYAGYIFDNMLCTASEGEDACQGDSGGPLIIRGDGPESDVQVGIVSWGIGCAYLPGVFSRVSRDMIGSRRPYVELRPILQEVYVGPRRRTVQLPTQHLVPPKTPRLNQLIAQLIHRLSLLRSTLRPPNQHCRRRYHIIQLLHLPYHPVLLVFRQHHLRYRLSRPCFLPFQLVHRHLHRHYPPFLNYQPYPSNQPPHLRLALHNLRRHLLLPPLNHRFHHHLDQALHPQNHPFRACLVDLP